jgi:hypothetical protein
VLPFIKEEKRRFQMKKVDQVNTMGDLFAEKQQSSGSPAYQFGGTALPNILKNIPLRVAVIKRSTTDNKDK